MFNSKLLSSISLIAIQKSLGFGDEILYFPKETTNNGNGLMKLMFINSVDF